MLEGLLRRFRKRHKDLNQVLDEFCKKHNLNKSDVVAAALTKYLSEEDEETAAALAEIMSKRAVSEPRGGGVNDIVAAVHAFKDLFNAFTDMMVSTQKAAVEIAKNSVLNELRGNIEMIKEIKKMGAEEKGVGDLLARALIQDFFRGWGIKTKQEQKPKQEKKYEIHEIEE